VSDLGAWAVGAATRTSEDLTCLNKAMKFRL
jgi:hypothetical protein